MKRTVERQVLLPLGRALATGRLEAGDLVTLIAREGRVEVSVASRAIEAGGAPTETEPQRTLREGIADRLHRLDQLRPRLAVLGERKTELILRTQHPGFYGDVALRESTFDELHKLDTFLARVERCSGAITGLAASSRAESTGVVARWEELEEELRQVELIATCRDAMELGDAVVSLKWVSGKGDDLEAVPALARMYLGLAARRHLTAQVLAEHTGEGTDAAYLQFTGLGAYGQLSAEVGLHEFRRRVRMRLRRGAPEIEREDQSIVLVEICPVAAATDRKFASRLTMRSTPLEPPVSRLVEQATWLVEAFDGTSVRSLVARFAGTRKVVQEGATSLLWSLVAAGGKARSAGAAEVPTPPAVVRQYELGQGACVRDLRTGRSTTRVSHVFRGQLDLLARR